MTNKILTFEEAKERGLYCYIYPNGDYEYETEEGHYHLIRDGVDLLKDKKAVACNSNPNGDYRYKTEDGKWHEVNKVTEEALNQMITDLRDDIDYLQRKIKEFLSKNKN